MHALYNYHSSLSLTCWCRLFSADSMAISKATGSSSGRSGRRSEVRKLNMSGGDLTLITERGRDFFISSSQGIKARAKTFKVQRVYSPVCYGLIACEGSERGLWLTHCSLQTLLSQFCSTAGSAQGGEGKV